MRETDTELARDQYGSLCLSGGWIESEVKEKEETLQAIERARDREEEVSKEE